MVGPNGIPIKVRNCLGDMRITWPTNLFNNIFKDQEDSW